MNAQTEWLHATTEGGRMPRLLAAGDRLSARVDELEAAAQRLVSVSTRVVLHTLDYQDDKFVKAIHDLDKLLA